ncbi:MAG: tetratricopeptide repeat protein [Meiothermus sp.]|nr:tetratricopeptide repeat protein [Meiothermus sp.]
MVRDSALRVRLFGGFQVAAGAVTLPGEVWRKKAADVIKLLALQPEGRLRREQVLEALWPGSGEKPGLNSLYQILHHARRLLEPALPKGSRPRYLLFEQDSLVLSPYGGLEVDYHNFRRLLTQARRTPDIATYEVAVALYAGDLLPDDLYEDWTEPHRDEARSLYLEALLELAELLEHGGNLPRAYHFLELAIARERTLEAAHLALMRLHARSGRRMEAVRQYQTLREALVQELGVEPDDATRALYDQVLQKLPDLPDLPKREAAAPAPLVGWVPAALTPLIGREGQLEEALQLLSAARSLTLTGAGGSGKTRLALEVASRLHAEASFEGGVWWVELVTLSDPRMVPATVAQALGIADSGKPPLQAVAEMLGGRRALLVLDNCEHLIEACAEVAVQLLRALPGLQLLSTSREALAIAGEIAWVVPPLEVPSAESARFPEGLSRLESVRLLVERIRQRDPRFALTEQNAESVVQICRRLEGLPLALELAAARVGLLTLEQIAARLDNSLRLLTRGQRGGLRHHQTLEAALQWSFALLGEAERNLFVRLAVFVGGWTPEAAEAVGGGADPDQLPELLARLEQVSMVLLSENDGRVRFRMLEPVRQFGAAKLEEAALLEEVRRGLIGWYARQTDEIVPRLSGPDQAAWYRHLSAEYENLRAVLAWGKALDLERSLHIAARLWRFFQVKGHAQEMLEWFEEALPLSGGVSVAVRADALNSAGIMARTCGLYSRSSELYQSALALRRELGDQRGEAVVLNNLGVNARDQADYPTVERYSRECLHIAREVGDRQLEALSLKSLGIVLRGRGDLEAAEAHLRDSLAIFAKLGEKRVLADIYNHLGGLAMSGERWAEAGRLYRQCLELNREVEDFWGIGIAARNLAALNLEQGDPAAAGMMLGEGLAHYRRAGVRHGLEECFETLAGLAWRQGNPELAAWAWGVVEQLEAEIGKVGSSGDRARRDHQYRELTAAIGEAEFARLRQAGQHERLEDAFNKALGGISAPASSVKR